MYISSEMKAVTSDQDVEVDYDIDSVILCCQVTFGILLTVLVVKCICMCFNSLSVTFSIAMMALIICQAKGVLPDYTFVIVHIALLTVITVINAVSCGIL